MQHWAQTLGLDLLLPLLGVLDGAGDLVQVLVSDSFSLDLLHSLILFFRLWFCTAAACLVARSRAGAGG